MEKTLADVSTGADAILLQINDQDQQKLDKDVKRLRDLFNEWDITTYNLNVLTGILISFYVQLVFLPGLRPGS